MKCLATAFNLKLLSELNLTIFRR